VSLAHEEVLVRYDDGIPERSQGEGHATDLGYTIRDPDKAKRYEQQQAELADGKRRLLLAGGASIVVAALMGWMIVVGRFESASPVMDLVTLGLALGTMFGPGRYITEKAFQSLRRGIFNQHVLPRPARSQACLVGCSACSSSPRAFRPSTSSPSPCSSPPTTSSEYTSLIVRTRASQTVQSLLDLQPDTARRVTDDGNVEDVPVDDIAVGDQVRVKPGENVPADGVVGGGKSTVDESVATGESIPEEKTEGDEVIGGASTRPGRYSSR